MADLVPAAATPLEPSRPIPVGGARPDFIQQLKGFGAQPAVRRTLPFAGAVGVPLPGVELGIAVSAVVLGLMVALAAKPRLWIAAVLVGAFAIFHGYAHGAELPPGADALAYSAGFVIATGVLHLLGIGFGLLAHRPAGRIAVRMAGGAIALAGVVFLGRLA